MTSRWDGAAGILLGREAGGFATEFAGGGDPLGTGSSVAATPTLHPQLLALFAEADTAKPR